MNKKEIYVGSAELLIAVGPRVTSQLLISFLHSPYTPSMAWCLVKVQGQLYLYLLPFGYFADLTVPVLSCLVVPDYYLAVAVKFSLFLVILFTDMYM
jgi:hypothetical protein